MSYRVGFEGKALVQLNGLPPGAFDAMVERVVDLVDAPWDADLMDARGNGLPAGRFRPGPWASLVSRGPGARPPGLGRPMTGRVASDDLFHDCGLGVGIMLHVPPGPLGQVALDTQVGVTVGVVRAEPVAEEQHTVDLLRTDGEHVQVDIGVGALEPPARLEVSDLNRSPGKLGQVVMRGPTTGPDKLQRVSDEPLDLVQRLHSLLPLLIDIPPSRFVIQPIVVASPV